MLKNLNGPDTPISRYLGKIFDGAKFLLSNILGAFAFFQVAYWLGLVRLHFHDVFPTILNRGDINISTLPMLLTSLFDGFAFTPEANTAPYVMGIGLIIAAPLLVVFLILFVALMLHTHNKEYPAKNKPDYQNRG